MAGVDGFGGEGFRRSDSIPDLKIPKIPEISEAEKAQTKQQHQQEQIQAIITERFKAIERLQIGDGLYPKAGESETPNSEYKKERDEALENIIQESDWGKLKAPEIPDPKFDDTEILA